MFTVYIQEPSFVMTPHQNEVQKRGKATAPATKTTTTKPGPSKTPTTKTTSSKTATKRRKISFSPANEKEEEGMCS